MKIDGPSTTSSTQASKRKKLSGSQGSDAFSSLLDDATAASGADAPTAASLSPAIAPIFSNEQEQESRQQALQRGSDLLDELDKLRHGLLMGSFSVESLQRMKERLTSNAPSLSDPRLLSLMQEIDTRVAVELAKLGKTR
jgi:hypothetical protein